MSDRAAQQDKAPGGDKHGSGGVVTYLAGLGFAVILTLASFWVAHTGLIWSPAVPISLAALAIAQMGVHVVFFFHVSSAPDQTNNFLALAFGIFVVGLVVFGSMIIMKNLNSNMMPMDQMLQLQR